MRKQVTAFVLSISVLSFTHNQFAPPIMEHELDQLAGRGLVHRMLGNGWIETQDPLTRETYRFLLGPILSPHDPPLSGLPTLSINRTTVDTNLYNWKYHYHSTIPVSGNWGFALQSGDLNQNLKTEVYGLYLDSSGYGTRICEKNVSNEWENVYTYPIRIGVVDNIADIDINGLREVYGSNADTVYVFEQQDVGGFPIVNKFRFRRYHLSAYLIPMELVDMTNDGRLELVYRGSEPDTIHTAIGKSYVAKYDTSANNFTPVWGEQLSPDCLGGYCTINLSSGDFDDDGMSDIVTSAFDGNVYLVEYAGNDSFSVVWSDSLTVAGRVASGDVDGNGTEEFFVGGNQVEGDGYVHMRIFAYESIGDNQYEPFFAFDIYPVGYFFVDLYQTVDIDHDGQEELLLSFGGGNIIIKGEGPHEYSLFYYAPIASSDGFSAGDVNGDNVPELFMGQFLGGEPVVRQTRVYSLDSSLVNVSEQATTELRTVHLRQNYPNPFNQETHFSYELALSSQVELSIYDILGEEINTLVNGQQNPGKYSVAWNGRQKGGENVATGVYLIRLSANGRSEVKKFLLLR